MEQKDIRQKRALNMVWTAADEYDFKPFVLFFRENGEPELYKNTLEGLAYRCLDEEVLLPFLRGVEVGCDPEKYLPYCLLALEQKIYAKMIPERPSLESLREEYAEERLKELGNARRYRPMDPGRIEMIHCLRITGGERFDQFTKDELSFAGELSDASLLPEKELVRRLKDIFGRRFYYKWINARRKEDAKFLGAGIFMLLAGDAAGETLVGKNGDEETLAAETKTPVLRKFLSHAVGKTTPEEDRSYIENTFGKPILPAAVIRHMEAKLCRELHRTCHLWYAGAELPEHSFTSEQQLQFQNNREYYRKDERYFERSIDRIAARLKHAMEEQLEPDVVNLRAGTLSPERVYRVQYMHELSIFHKEIIFPTPDFSVDLLMDASSSRFREQENIAAEAYMITKSLMKLDIPVQVSCFRSLRTYTVLQQLKSYEDESADGIFRFFTAGSNRDGLALRALEPLIRHGENRSGTHYSRRILLILTDATPADTTRAYVAGAVKKLQEYEGELAVNDTREAVLQLKREGTHVAAIFWGLKQSVPDLRWMYGDSFIRITEIRQLPDAVIGLLLKAIADIRDH